MQPCQSLRMGRPRSRQGAAVLHESRPPAARSHSGFCRSGPQSQPAPSLRPPHSPLLRNRKGQFAKLRNFATSALRAVPLVNLERTADGFQIRILARGKIGHVRLFFLTSDRTYPIMAYHMKGGFKCHENRRKRTWLGHNPVTLGSNSATRWRSAGQCGRLEGKS